jgi:tetratricopeptide (TPR) repeat protein
MGLAYAAVCGAIVLRAGQSAVRGEPPAHPIAFSGTAGAWFQQIKPYCNAVEVETHLRQVPPPSGVEGAGYGAACYALAGKIERARELILALSAGERGNASSIVFNIGHPVADAGDDRSAGPIMELVLEFWPENYMALYHAGISEYALGETEKSRLRLRQFLELYHENDGWRSNAIEVLARMEGPER